MLGSLLRLIEDESGVSAIEYTLISFLLAISLILGATLAGTALNKTWEGLGTTISTVTP
jgi:pilus assembly protein Flp/PilA